MTVVTRISIALLVGTCAVATAFHLARAERHKAPVSLAFAGRVSDSAQLAALGIHPGRQLIAFVFGSSSCGSCNRPAVKNVFATLGDSLRHVHAANAAAVSIVGVAIARQLDDGLAYLRSIGLSQFDEISTGNAWRNENITNLVRYRGAAEPGVPLVIVLSRRLDATASPLTLHMGPDTIVAAIQGADAITAWASKGYPLAAITK